MRVSVALTILRLVPVAATIEATETRACLARSSLIDGGAVPRGPQPLRCQRPQRLPLPLRLIKLGDKAQHFRGNQGRLRHSTPDLYPIYPIWQ